MTTQELIQQYVTAHADNRWMDASELEALLTEFAEKLTNQPKTREALFREYMQATPTERRKFDLSFLDETRKEALAILTDLGYECKLSQEPASEDLSDLIDKLSKRYPEVSFAKLSRIVVSAAKWQREQMMKDAVDGEVNIWCSHISLPKVLPSEFSKQRVKVIIIKE